jgi:hypothetical protein
LDFHIRCSSRSLDPDYLHFLKVLEDPDIDDPYVVPEKPPERLEATASEQETTPLIEALNERYRREQMRAEEKTKKLQQVFVSPRRSTITIAPFTFYICSAS